MALSWRPGTAERRPPPRPPSPPLGPARAAWARLAAAASDTQRPAVNVRWVGRGAKWRCFGVGALMRGEASPSSFEAFWPARASPCPRLAGGGRRREGAEWADSRAKGWVFLSSEESGRCLPAFCGLCISGQPSPRWGHTAYVKRTGRGCSLFRVEVGAGSKVPLDMALFPPDVNQVGKDAGAAQVPSPDQGI